MANVKLITILIILGLFVLFIVQNTSLISIQVFFWWFEMSRVLLLFLVLAVGILTGWLLHAYMVCRKLQSADLPEEEPLQDIPQE